MRNLLCAIVCFVTINGFALQSVLADSNNGLSIGDAESVPDAVAHITAALEEQGFDIVAIIDHAAAAASVNLDLAPTQVIFARPNRIVERLLLKRSTTIGIDLPFKFLVFEDDGEIKVKFNSVSYLVDRHDIKIKDPLLRYLDSKIEQFGDADNGLVTVESLNSLDDTVENLLSAIPSPPFRIPLVLDYDEHRGHDRIYRGRHQPVLIVFGNPVVGTPLMQTDQDIAIDLPQKFLVWEDRNGMVNITYNDPFFIAERHNIQGQDERLQMIANALANFAQTGAAGN